MSHHKNTFRATLYEDEFPSLSQTESKDFTNINTSTADSLSYCAKLKTSQFKNNKNVQIEREICNDESFYKTVVSKKNKMVKPDLITNSQLCYKSQKILGNLSEKTSMKKRNPRLSNLSHDDDQELVTFSDQSDEQDKGWVIVKKKIPHFQTDENNKVFNKNKIQCESFLKTQTTSVNSDPLPKHMVQNIPCTSKKNYFYDSKISSNKLSLLQNKVTDSVKKNNSRNVKFQRGKVETGKSIKRGEVLYKPNCIKDSNKQIKNIPFHTNVSEAVRTFNKKNQFDKEKISQIEKQYSTDIIHKEQVGILNRTRPKSFESLSSLNKQEVDRYPKNKTENIKHISSKNDFTGFVNKNLNKSINDKFFGDQHTIDSKKTTNKPLPGSNKKKRKSKIKRQVAMQSDKIRLITPEMFSKIMKSNDGKVQSSKNIAVNIYDSNEYPELGSSLVSVLNTEKDGLELFPKKDTPRKFSLTIEKNDIDSGIMESLEENSDYLKDHDTLVESNFIGDESCDLKKLPVHYNNPITISLIDVLSVNKLKKKESEKSKEFHGNLLSSKFSVKKQTFSDHHQIVNPLDSSKPAIKRGKEREKPKPKRLSKFKKIILLDREKRKKQLLNQYMWNKLCEEKDVFSHCATSSVRTIEKGLMKSSTSNFCNSKMQLLFQINNNEETFNNVEGEKLSEYTKLLNLYSLLENNINISGQDLESCINLNSVIKSENEINFQQEKLNSEKKHLCTELTKSFEEEEISYLTSQVPPNDTKYEMKLEESETNEHKLLNPFKTQIQNFAFEELKHKEELNKFSKTVQNHLSNSSLINETESTKSVTSLTTLCKDIYYDSSLNENQYLFENWGALKTLSEEQNLDEILCDIQYLFLHERDFNTFPCTNVSTELHYNLLNDVASNNETNNFYNLSTVDDMHIPEKMREGSGLVESTDKTYKHSFASSCICETGNLSEKLTHCGIHCRHSDKNVLKAANIILHSKKFRDYCTHFSSKKLGESVLALLDDLTRFQDRMHQKDPIKARMKRRLIYGIKEIKRHMKLKKLKCIIIATDIEDSKTEGSLNDIINDLKALAKDYHVPCVFSHLRKKLGQVCHKPAPVSAVGILNYEGSEVNFKKILELHSECKTDYEKVLKSLLSKLTYVQVELLHTTKVKDSAHLNSVVINLLKELFPQSNEIDKSSINQSIKNIPEEALVSKENPKYIMNKDAVEDNEINNILKNYKILN